MGRGAAARVAGWRRDNLGAWPASSTLAGTPPLSAFPQVPLDISVAIWVDASWVDITPYAYGGDRAIISIERGQSSEGGQVDPARLEMELNNRDGQFSPRNPVSWLYGKIGRNTPIRVAIGADVRFVGEVTAWPQRWDRSGADVWVPIEAAGILQRLGQGAIPIHSTMFRAMTTLDPLPEAYWPCEDGTSSTSIASASPAGPMTLRGPGTPDFETNSNFVCSAPLPTFSQTEWTGIVPFYTATGTIQVLFLLQVPSGGALDAEGICLIRTSGSAHEWRLLYEAGAGGDFTMQAYDADGVQLFTQTSGFDIDGDLILVAIRLVEIAGDVEWTLQTLEVGQTAPTQLSNTLASETIGRATVVVMNAGADHTDVTAGHVSAHSEELNIVDLADVLTAHAGETAGTRLERLCDQESVSFRAVGDLTATAAMGPQLPLTLLDLLRECEAADGGVLYEPRDELGLAYRTREALCALPATLTLDYASADLSSIEPTDDDQLTRNDITVKRDEGSSARAVQDTGPLSIQAPPDGVGLYDEEVTLNLENDLTLEDRAGWLLHLGTVDEARYPVLGVDLARANFIGANADKGATVRQLDIGDRLVVENPPAWIPPEDISQLAMGFTETLANFTHTIEVNCVPETPWGEAGHYDDGVARYTSDGSTLAAEVAAGVTTLSVATASGPLWAHDDGDFDLLVSGERMTVTAVSGASSPQSFTVTRAVNGIAKALSAGATVELFHPSVYVP